MNEAFGPSLQLLSCVCLGCLLLLECIALRTVMREALLLRHVYEPAPGREAALLSVRVKPFRATLMDCSDVLTDADLLGRVTTLLFVQPSELFAQSKEVLAALLHSLWTKRQGPLYVVCSGSLADCQLLRDKYRLGRKHSSSVDVILDQAGALRTSFSVTAVLMAVVIDENRRILKVGGVDSDEVMEAPSGVTS